MSASNFSWFFIGLFLITSFHLSAGKLKVDSIFGNRMVLQKGKSTSITGTGTPGAEVAVTFAGKTEIVKNNADGVAGIVAQAGHVFFNCATCITQWEKGL